jgi:hypothetical protein
MNKRKAYTPLRRDEADSNDLRAETAQGVAEVRCSLGSAGSITPSLARDIALVDAATKESGGVDAGDGEGVSTGRVEGVEEMMSMALLEAYFTHMDKKYEQWIREAEGGGGEEEDEEYEDEEDEVEV